ncbi:MAG: S8 family peptidase [Candidatus Sericytochromatia bacterium]
MLKHSRLAAVALVLTACTGKTLAPSVPPSASPPPVTRISAARVPVETAETIRNEVIVKYRSGFSTKASVRVPGAEIIDAINTSDDTTQLYKLSGQTSLEQALSSYQADPGVEFAMPNLRFKVQMEPVTGAAVAQAKPAASAVRALQAQDPYSGQQWYLSQLGMEEVWGTYGTGSNSVTVAVLDTGVDYTHPDLAGKIIKGADYIDKDFDPKDEHGHGTHVAGIVAASLNNAQGISGLAPTVRVLAVRVLDEKGSGSLFNIAKGIAYAANQGAKVINMSLGSPSGGSIMRTLANFIAGYAETKGSLIIAAAGNAGGTIGFPAAASKFVAVGAINEEEYLASFSNRGAELDVVAPGVNILSTFPTYEVTSNAQGLSQNYAALSGTSMATPMVAALAAMIWSKSPYLTPSQVRNRLETRSTDLGPIGRDDLFGAGAINPARALSDGD